MPPAKRPPEKPKNVLGTLKRIFSYLSESRFLLIAVFVCIALTSLSQVIGGSLLKPVIDDGIAPLVQDPHNAELMGKFILMLCGWVWSTVWVPFAPGSMPV